MTVQRDEVGNILGKRFGGQGADATFMTMVPHVFPDFNTDDAIFIHAGPHPVNFLEQDPKEIAEYILAQNPTATTKIVFDNLFEGYFDTVVDSIYYIAELSKLPADQFYYFAMVMNGQELLSTYHQYRGTTRKRIHVKAANLWEMHAAKLSAPPVPYAVGPREKLFTCFNRVLRPHRTALLGVLSDRGLVENSFYSFFPKSIFGPWTWRDQLWEIETWDGASNRPFAEEVRRGIEKLDLPLTLNIEPEDNCNLVRQDDRRYFVNSYFSLVTETFFAPMWRRSMAGMDCVEDHAVFFSEKVYKPILMKHPFILASVPGSLPYLRRLGFYTFAPFINEEYDTIYNNTERIHAIATEVERLSKFSDDEWSQWQRGVIPILEYNYSIIKYRASLPGRTCYAVNQ